MTIQSEALSDLRRLAASGNGCAETVMISLMQGAGCAIDNRGYPTIPADPVQAEQAYGAVMPYIKQLRQQNAEIDARIQEVVTSGEDMLHEMKGAGGDVYAVQHPGGGLIFLSINQTRESAVESFLAGCDDARYNRTAENSDLINWRKYAKLGFKVVRLAVVAVEETI